MYTHKKIHTHTYKTHPPTHLSAQVTFLNHVIVSDSNHVILSARNTHTYIYTHDSHTRTQPHTCLLKLLFSITSSSVTVMTPFSPHATPIIAKFLNSSQPRAPQPTMKYFKLASFSCRPLPRTATWPSYLCVVCMYVCINVFMYACMYVCVYVCMQSRQTHTNTCMQYTHVHEQEHVCTHVYTHMKCALCMGIYVHIFKCI
jgi:hypothetical protein